MPSLDCFSNVQRPGHSAESSHQQGERGAEEGGQGSQGQEGGETGGGAEVGGECEVEAVRDQNHPQRVGGDEEAFIKLDAGYNGSVTHFKEGTVLKNSILS